MLSGWFLYSRFIAKYIFALDPTFITPAHEFKDGVDYHPTNKYVLWGHHFTSVAGAAPIVGPAIAVYWGWLPAVLWVTLGTIFFAGIHDFGALWISARHEGKSIGALAKDIVGERTRALFMIIVFLVLLMVNAVFGVVIANAFVDAPESVLPAWSAIVVALIIGQLLKRKFSLTILTVLGVAILYGMIFVGSSMPIALPEVQFGVSDKAMWILILFAYAAVASVLPVWALLQPRDFINGIQLFIGLGLLYGATLISMPDLAAPAINRSIESGPSLIPLLFITIACGAISGFHGIVSSGTTSKQLDKEPDARFVGYLGAVGEGALALVTIIVVSSVALAETPAQWHAIYEQYGTAGADVFIEGGARLIENGWRLPTEIGSTLLATMVVLFAGTTMDSGLRLQRYIIQEWGEIYRVRFLQNGIVATLVAVAACLLLAFGVGGADGSGGLMIWPLFGSTNQILAALTLLVISIYLIRLGRNAYFTLAPMAFVLLFAVWASIIKFFEWWREKEWVLMIVDIIVICASIMVILEALSALLNIRRQKQRK